MTTVTEPLAIRANYPPPKGRVDPDTSRSWVRRLSPILLSHRTTIAIGLSSALVMVVISTFIPKLVALGINEGLVKGRRPLQPYAVAIASLAMVRFGLSYLFRYYLSKTSQAIEFDLRSLLFQHLNRLSFSFYDQVQTGQLISRANSDIRMVERFLTFSPMMIVTAVQFVVALVFMIGMHLKLTLVSLIPLPFVFLTGRYLRSRLFPISWLVQSRAADLATIVEESVTGVRVVKSFTAERQQIGLLARVAARLRWATIMQIDLRAKFAPIMESLPRLGFLLVLVYGGWLVIQGQILIGVIVAFSSYILMLQVPFRMLGFLVLMQQRAAASAQRIFEIIDTQPAIVDRPGAVDLVSPKGRVEFENVVFSYGPSAEVLKGFNLLIEPGETVAMVGRTGCGKSTAARLVARFYDVDEGRVLIDGMDVKNLTLTSLRAHVGLVLDEPFLFSESIRDNIAYGKPGADFDDVVAAARAAGAEDFIEDLPHGYDTIIGERGYTLSGGQRQRVAIARTLLMNPPILILDDATSSVDVHIEQEIHEALRTLMKGRTTLIIAHRLSTIGLADRVVLVDDGRVVAEGPHQQLVNEVPLYAEVLAREEEWAAQRTSIDEVPASRFEDDTRFDDDIAPESVT